MSGARCIRPRALCALALALLAGLVSPQLDTSSTAESCVDWEGRSARPLGTCLPHRPPLQHGCQNLNRLSLNRQVGYSTEGAACCTEVEEVAIMQSINTIMGAWQGGALEGRCLDIVQMLTCALGCSPQQSTYVYRHALAPPPPAPAPPDTRTCLDPTCDSIDGDGRGFDQLSCDAGYHLKPDQAIVCAEPYCSSAECCEVDEPSCDDIVGDNSDQRYARCRHGYHLVDNLATPGTTNTMALCDGPCDDEDCCEENPTCGDTGTTARDPTMTSSLSRICSFPGVWSQGRAASGTCGSRTARPG